MSDHDLMNKMTFYTLNDAGKYLGWLQRPGSKILVVAHIDYHCSGRVHKANSEIVVSSALDDRLGVYMAMEALPAMGIPCDVLLTDDEESAMSTMQHLGMGFLRRYNWIVELDYPGEGVSTHGFEGMRAQVEELYGPAPPVSFTDISFVRDYSPISAFNAPIGYVNQHTESCSVNMHVFARCLGKLKVFYDRHKDTRFVEHDDHILTEPMHDTKYNVLNSTKSTGVAWNDKHYDYDDGRGRYGGAAWLEPCTICTYEHDVMDMETYDGHYVCRTCNSELTKPLTSKVVHIDDNTKQARHKRAKSRKRA
jgi:hypothetical protein